MTNNMKSLNLSGNNMKDIGAIKISQGIIQNKSLKQILLNTNNISYEGAIELSKSLTKNKALQIFCLRIFTYFTI